MAEKNVLEFRIDDADLRTAVAAIDVWSITARARVSTAVWDSAGRIQKGARANARRRSGNLAASIRRQKVGDYGAEVGTNVFYAKYVELGTKPHTIAARRAKFLRFEVNGEVIFRRKVRHPGTKPMPCLFPAAEADRLRFNQGMREAIRR